jgi:hypothetical protein
MSDALSAYCYVDIQTNYLFGNYFDGPYVYNVTKRHYLG